VRHTLGKYGPTNYESPWNFLNPFPNYLNLPDILLIIKQNNCLNTIFKFRDVLMNKCRRFFRQNFSWNMPQTLGANSFLPHIPISIQTIENMQDSTPIEHFWLIQILGNLGAKQNLYFIFWPLPPLSKKRSRAIGMRNALNSRMRILWKGSRRWDNLMEGPNNEGWNWN